MNENETMIPEHVNYLMNLLKSYEMFFRKNMENLDINIGEIPILMEIYTNEGLNQIDLVRQFHVTEANISKITKNLLIKGLITKTIDAENNTKKILLLTEDGKKTCQILLDIFDQWKDATIGDIPTDELVAFARTLKKLSDNSVDVLS
ncbi:MAG: MarR family transcriptional regulator [Methanobrevibacter ruminantium]|uniref:MarR family winged helix-turn-helix transcriptional regulator n=1 Tax=Methanobrevibacter ruminantium TaxID=83816 RepID=UPI0026F24A06|nr:MarR family transcriptional regulator [Methanobrevibacter ruminantium]MCI5737822.1 MarR family transcriptional regulator [Methanobrevibacter ruminantium]MDD6048131.1 MarR family transcriptional regulator [Methanobrevibacter ruminantium]MDO5843252.1 MarR family transcriptional regulator [Methanobrevibacter ruminantium]